MAKREFQGSRYILYGFPVVWRDRHGSIETDNGTKLAIDWAGDNGSIERTKEQELFSPALTVYLGQLVGLCLHSQKIKASGRMCCI